LKGLVERFSGKKQSDWIEVSIDSQTLDLSTIKIVNTSENAFWDSLAKVLEDTLSLLEV
jgi:hypothetical protein